MTLPFIKMNGAGNDFVILDARETPVRLTTDQVKWIASRGNSATRGCDQVIVMERSQNADVFMRIYNADGSQVDACGNATRCVASILEEELQRLPVTIETNAGLLRGLEKAYSPEDVEYILVDMGAPKFDASQIPLSMPVAEAESAIQNKLSSLIPNPSPLAPHFVSMGNPHVVFFLRFMPDDDSARDEAPLFDLAFNTIGPELENATGIFPERVNVSIALLRAASDGLGHIINARVWERGAGLTQACGTAACAMLAAAHKLDESISEATVWFEPFGTMVTTKIDENGHVLLGGPIEIEFEGVLKL